MTNGHLCPSERTSEPQDGPSRTSLTTASKSNSWEHAEFCSDTALCQGSSRGPFFGSQQTSGLDRHICKSRLGSTAAQHCYFIQGSTAFSVQGDHHLRTSLITTLILHACFLTLISQDQQVLTTLCRKVPSSTRHAQDKPLMLQLQYARCECCMQLLPTKYLLAKDFYFRSYIKTGQNKYKQWPPVIKHAKRIQLRIHYMHHFHCSLK